MLSTLNETQKRESTQYLFVLGLYPSFCLLVSTSLNFTTPFCLCCTTLRTCNEVWSTSGISVPVISHRTLQFGDLQGHCWCFQPHLPGSGWENLWGSQAVAISAHSVATSWNSPAFKDAGCLLAKSLLPNSPPNSFKLFLTVLES